MDKWTLPTVSEVMAFGAASLGAGLAPSVQPATSPQVEVPHVIQPATAPTQRSVRAEQQWFGAIAALNALLLSLLDSTPEVVQGFVLSAPSSPVIHPVLTERLSTWMFSLSSLEAMGSLPLQLLPGGDELPQLWDNPSSVLPLLPIDPLADEQFCLVLTHKFSLTLNLSQTPAGNFEFQFSFDPQVAHSVWEILRPRVLVTSPQHLAPLNSLFHQFSPVAPDYRVVTQFSRLLLDHLPEPLERDEPKRFNRDHSGRPRSESYADYQVALATPQEHHRAAQFSSLSEAVPTSDMELLRAIAHEVRTPLTTIRTLTRSLLKRQDLSPQVIQRLEKIDRECSEQINRFSLIFKAVELETSTAKHITMPLASTPLDQVFQQSIPRWQQQAHQRNLTLEVLLPQQMPTVVSDPTVLDQALTGLIERFTRNLPAGSHIQVEATPAGDQLKLQLCSFSDTGKASWSSLKALGQLLAFQPETGSLSLSMSMTKNLFQALGGKLIVRQKPQQGEVLTIFLPLENSRQNSPLETKGSDMRIV